MTFNISASFCSYSHMATPLYFLPQPICLVDNPEFSEPISDWLVSEESPKKITIIAHVAEGFGDFSTCAKMFKYLKETFKKYTINLALLNQNRAQMANFPEVQSATTLYESYTQIDQKKHDLIIDYPANVKILGRLDTEPRIVPHLRLLEYGFGDIVKESEMFSTLWAEVEEKMFTSLFDSETYSAVKALQRPKSKDLFSLGLGENELGLVIDEDLYAFYKERMSSMAKLEYLSTLPSALTEILLDEPYSAEAIIKFSQGWRLYFGYSHYDTSKDLFIQVMIALTESTEENISFVLVGNPSTLMPMNMDPHMLDALHHLGVTEIDVYLMGIDSTMLLLHDYQPLGKKEKNSRRIKIISCPNIEHQHMKALLKASEKEILATGNQMITEGLMAGKYIVYELRKHTRTFINDLINVAEKINSSLSVELKKTLGANFLKGADRETITTISQGLRNLKGLEIYFEGLIDHIYFHHNGLKNIAKLIKEHLSDVNKDQFSLTLEAV